MTSNQHRAAALARAIHEGSAGSADVSDDDWSLLLLAAGLNSAASRPLIVSRLVLEHAADHVGYFAPGWAWHTTTEAAA